MRTFLRQIQDRAFAPIDIASLVFFRVAFGLLMVWEVGRYFKNESVYHFWLEPKFLFK
jgi:vitamin K-dependent gamma-carboxylase